MGISVIFSYIFMAIYNQYFFCSVIIRPGSLFLTAKIPWPIFGLPAAVISLHLIYIQTGYRVMISTRMTPNDHTSKLQGRLKFFKFIAEAAANSGLVFKVSRYKIISGDKYSGVVAVNSIFSSNLKLEPKSMSFISPTLYREIPDRFHLQIVHKSKS